MFPILKSLLLILILIGFSSMASAQGVLGDGTLSEVEQAELDALEKGEKLDRSAVVGDQEEENQNIYSDMRDSDQDIIIRQIDRELGIFLDDYTTDSDQHRFGLQYHFNSDLKNPFEMATFEGNYAYRLGVAWLEFCAALTRGKYREMTRINNSIGGETEDQLEQTASNLSIGGGLGYRTRYIRNLIKSDNIFETIAAYLTYNSFSDTNRSESYTGYGIKADFGVHKRTGARSHWGMKMSYNLATVRKSEEFEGQGSAARSLTLTWLTLGLDYSFYF